MSSIIFNISKIVSKQEEAGVQLRERTVYLQYPYSEWIHYVVTGDSWTPEVALPLFTRTQSRIVDVAIYKGRTITVESEVIEFTTLNDYVIAPEILAPVGEIKTAYTTIQGSLFASFAGTLTHRATNWWLYKVSEDGAETLVQSSLNDTVNKLLWRVEGLETDCSYTPAVQYVSAEGSSIVVRGSKFNSSPVSSVLICGGKEPGAAIYSESLSLSETSGFFGPLANMSCASMLILQNGDVLWYGYTSNGANRGIYYYTKDANTWHKKFNMNNMSDAGIMLQISDTEVLCFLHGVKPGSNTYDLGVYSIVSHTFVRWCSDRIMSQGMRILIEIPFRKVALFGDNGNIGIYDILSNEFIYTKNNNSTYSYGYPTSSVFVQNNTFLLIAYNTLVGKSNSTMLFNVSDYSWSDIGIEDEVESKEARPYWVGKTLNGTIVRTSYVGYRTYDENTRSWSNRSTAWPADDNNYYLYPIQGLRGDVALVMGGWYACYEIDFSTNTVIAKYNMNSDKSDSVVRIFDYKNENDIDFVSLSGNVYTYKKGQCRKIHPEWREPQAVCSGQSFHDGFIPTVSPSTKYYNFYRGTAIPAWWNYYNFSAGSAQDIQSIKIYYSSILDRASVNDRVNSISILNNRSDLYNVSLDAGRAIKNLGVFDNGYLAAGRQATSGYTGEINLFDGNTWTGWVSLTNWPTTCVPIGDNRTLVFGYPNMVAYADGTRIGAMAQWENDSGTVDGPLSWIKCSDKRILLIFNKTYKYFTPSTGEFSPIQSLDGMRDSSLTNKFTSLHLRNGNYAVLVSEAPGGVLSRFIHEYSCKDMSLVQKIPIEWSSPSGPNSMCLLDI